MHQHGSDDRSASGCIASVVIRCFNEEQHIARLLCGIREQTLADVEIVIVDSGSTDATLHIASCYPVKVVSVSPDEFSFGRSLNAGCRAASGPLIAIASAHVYPVYNDWLERLLAPFADPQVALVYGKQRGCETTRYSEHRIFAQWFPDEGNPQQDHPFCNNANAAIRRCLWERLPYDETLTGLEDVEWAKRAMQMGFKVAYVPEAEVVHVHSESPRRIYNRYRREAIAMKHIFPLERFGLLDFAHFSLVNIVSDCHHALRDRALRRNLSDIVVFRLAQFWGTYRGFCQRHPVSRQLRRTFYYPSGLADSTPRDVEVPPRRRIEYVTCRPGVWRVRGR